VDYNAWGTGGVEPWSGVRYKELAAKHGWDSRSLYVEFPDVFQEKVSLPAGKPYYSSKLKGHVIPKDWHFDHYLLLPRPDSKLIDAGTVLPNLTGPYLGKAPDLGAHELGLGTAWYGPRTWDEAAGLIYGSPKGWAKTPLTQAAALASLGCPPVESLRVERPAENAKVLLTGKSPKLFALLCAEPSAGEARWTRARKLVASDEGAATKVLEFQDGLYIRLVRKGDNAALLAARVEPDGVLHVTCGCRQADLPKARLQMFQFVRSLVR
jgi:hypothetical protein